MCERVYDPVYDHVYDRVCVRPYESTYVCERTFVSYQPGASEIVKTTEHMKTWDINYYFFSGGIKFLGTSNHPPIIVARKQISSRINNLLHTESVLKSINLLTFSIHF